jgi:hypothetical protein
VRHIGGFWGGPTFGKVLHCWLLLRDYYFGNASMSKLNIRSEVTLSDLGGAGLWRSACYLPNHGKSGLRCKLTHIHRPMRDLFGMQEVAVNCVCEVAGSTSCGQEAVLHNFFFPFSMIVCVTGMRCIAPHS